MALGSHNRSYEIGLIRGSEGAAKVVYTWQHLSGCRVYTVDRSVRLEFKDDNGEGVCVGNMCASRDGVENVEREREMRKSEHLEIRVKLAEIVQ